MYNSNVVANEVLPEYGKFVEIKNDSRFPAISVTRWDYRDSGVALSAVSVYPKYAVLTYDVSSAVANSSPFGDNAAIDAFGRLRVSNPYSLFDSKSLHDKSPLVFSQVVNGTGDIQFDTYDASVNLTTAANNDYAVRQTFTRFGYQPGKSQLAFFTGVMSLQNNIIKRYGLFTSLTAAPYTPNCGLYFESSNGVISVQINNSQTGTTVPSQSAAQSVWNIDKLDGTGSSGITLDFTKAQIFTIDYEWLGVGRVRFGFVIDGKIYYCHQFLNANNTIAPYIFTPNLPVRAEIRQTGAGSGTMRMICQSVISEGGHDMAGVTHGIYTGNTGLDISTKGNRRAVLGIRLQPDKLDSITQVIEGYAGVNPSGTSSVGHFRWEIVLNPTIGGTTPVWTNVTNSNLQSFIATDATNTVTGGTVLLAGIANVGAPINITNADFQRFKKLGCSVDGTRDELYIVITPLVNPSNDGVWASLTYLDCD